MTYVRFMKDVEEGKIISVKSLELQEEFAKGRLDDFNYSSDLPESPSIGVFVISISGRPRTRPISFTSVTVKLQRGLKSPALSPYLVAYPT